MVSIILGNEYITEEACIYDNFPLGGTKVVFRKPNKYRAKNNW